TGVVIPTGVVTAGAVVATGSGVPTAVLVAAGGVVSTAVPGTRRSLGRLRRRLRGRARGFLGGGHRERRCRGLPAGLDDGLVLAGLGRLERGVDRPPALGDNVLAKL